MEMISFPNDIELDKRSFGFRCKVLKYTWYKPLKALSWLWAVLSAQKCTVNVSQKRIDTAFKIWLCSPMSGPIYDSACTMSRKCFRLDNFMSILLGSVSNYITLSL